MADDDFQSRVAKIFGSLAFSRTSSSKYSTSSAPASRQQSGSVWTLSDAEVEKREWKRDSYHRDEIPCVSSFDEVLRQQRISTADGEPLEDDRGEDCDDAWSIRASMGLDRTLDNEAEEDEYDKVALGEDNGGEALSMKDDISTLSGGRLRDPRANYVAAKIRLKEDEIEANKLKAFVNQPSKSKEPQTEESSHGVPPKPILKRKENSSDSEARISKRVRFDCVSEETEKKPEDTCSASTSLNIISLKSKSDARVPDYLLNPSKYTRYTFDPSSEGNDKSPTEDYMDIPKAIEASKTSDTDTESFKKVSFIPKKKTKDVREVSSSKCSETKPIVAGELAEDESQIATEDGDTEIEESDSSTKLQKSGRQYRAKRSVDETVD